MVTFYCSLGPETLLPNILITIKPKKKVHFFWQNNLSTMQNKYKYSDSFYLMYFQCKNPLQIYNHNVFGLFTSTYEQKVCIPNYKKISFHPSLHPLSISFICQDRGDTWGNPSWLWVRGGVHPGKIANLAQRQTAINIPELSPCKETGLTTVALCCPPKDMFLITKLINYLH